MPSDGIEPATSSLLVTRSTIELRGRLYELNHTYHPHCLLMQQMCLFGLIKLRTTHVDEVT
jgi:hypothetical protein